MEDIELAEYYQQIYGKTLAEPENENDVKNILSCIRTQHGFFDSDDEDQLQKTTSNFQKKINMFASKSRKVLAKFTKAISSQLYDDPFRFFYELIQNADDAKYQQSQDLPSMTIRVYLDKLVIDTNEDGFNLQDVLSICDTGQSSKQLDEESTGEKGFGFKAVFGVADKVGVHSGLWSFRFEHQRQEDGMGMITPIWEQRETLAPGIRTRFYLRYATTEHDGRETRRDIWKQLQAQHPSLLFALRKLKKISIIFHDVEGQNNNICFEQSSTGSIRAITASVSGNTTQHFYRTFSSLVNDMPRQSERPQTAARLTIGLPVTAQADGLPVKEANGQYVFAYLPVMQLAQLPFIIHADFLLPGSRQSVSENAWNRKLRDEIIKLFVGAIKQIVDERTGLSYQWLAYIPGQSSGFWEPLADMIRRNLVQIPLCFSKAGAQLRPHQLRILEPIFKHDTEPLFEDNSVHWKYLSPNYDKAYLPALKSLGVTNLTYQEALELVESDLMTNTPKVQQIPLSDSWHDSFLTYVERARVQHRGKLQQLFIIPVRVNDKLQWYRPGPNIYLPNVVDEGTGPDRIKIDMPRRIDLVALHPAAAQNFHRREVYEILGVCKCPPPVLCRAIERAQETAGSKFTSDLLSYFELLFWFSHNLSLSGRRSLNANTNGDIYSKSNTLFMRSNQTYHAESLLDLSQNPNYNKHFLDSMYQESVVSTRTRGGMSWEQWLCDVAGARWYPTLSEAQNSNKLHWIVETVRDSYPSKFIPMIQHYWAREYSTTCRFTASIKQALMKSKVLCLNNGSEELAKAWFPAKNILEVAQYYGVDQRLPLIALPGSSDGSLISEWPCLAELGCRTNAGLPLHRECLAALARSNAAPPIGIGKMNWLYKRIGEKATLEDQDALKDDFGTKNLVWDPSSCAWRDLDECVLESRLHLTCRFVIESAYDLDMVSGLFSTYLETSHVTEDVLIEELRHLKVSMQAPEVGMTVHRRATTIYEWLLAMASSPDTKELLRSVFKKEALVYSEDKNEWLKSTSCIWHSTVDIGGHVPIAATYQELEKFFVDILGTSTVTDKFLMKQLASAASKEVKVAADIKTLMISASEMLDISSEPSKFRNSIEVLEGSDFLPCVSANGENIFCSPDDKFFIVDNEFYGNRFRGELILLDFTYEQLNSLHELFRILRLDNRYLRRHVEIETTAGTSNVDEILTHQLRQCAYPISCCAIAYQSSAFANNNKRMYNDLVAATVLTSANMSTKLVVDANGTQVKVESEGASLVVDWDDDKVQIILPSNKTERKKSMRGQLPGKLAELLQIYDLRAERQIYRIMIELESGTDEIMLDEKISRVSWITETARPAPESRSETSSETAEEDEANDDGISGVAGDVVGVSQRFGQRMVEIRQFTDAVPAADDIPIHYSEDVLPPPPPYRALPEVFNHELEAPDYKKVLEHVRKQAASLGSGLRDISNTTTTDDLANMLSGMSLEISSLDPADYPRLFGTDVWLSKFRVGVAGELFAYELLRWITTSKLNLEHWESSIRHLVQAHPDYAHVTRRGGRETADIVFQDLDNTLAKELQTTVFGDNFEGWRPSWLADALDGQEPIEWLFEVKTTVGPCEADFYMSQTQYNLLRSLSDDEPKTPHPEGALPTPPHGRRSNRVYCIVRVYNLLSDKIGVRFYIDPWRFREGKLEFGTTDKWKVRPLGIQSS